MSSYRRLDQCRQPTSPASFKEACPPICLDGIMCTRSAFGTPWRASARWAHICLRFSWITTLPRAPLADPTIWKLFSSHLQNFAEAPEIQQKFADVASLFLANIRKHIQLTLIQHLSAMSGLTALSREYLRARGPNAHVELT